MYNGTELCMCLIKSIDQFSKSHNAPVSHPTMHHSQQKCVYFCSEWCIAGYERGALWDFGDGSSLSKVLTIVVPYRTWHLKCCCSTGNLTTEFMLPSTKYKLLEACINQTICENLVIIKVPLSQPESGCLVAPLQILVTQCNLPIILLTPG